MDINIRLIWIKSTAPLMWLRFQWQNQSYLSTHSGSCSSSYTYICCQKQNKQNLEVVLKSTQFWQLNLNTHLYKFMIKQNHKENESQVVLKWLWFCLLFCVTPKPNKQNRVIKYNLKAWFWFYSWNQNQNLTMSALSTNSIESTTKTLSFDK